MNPPLALEHALKACIRYILERQLPEGYWLDWDLPPGPCATWTTAYIGYALQTLPPHLAQETQSSRHSAAQWLMANEFPEHGWGYNTLVGIDADSTAHAILFLAGEGLALSERHYQRLETFQCSDGGFSTYSPDAGYGSWSVSHPDVTPLALRALLTSTQYSWNHPVIRRGMAYLAAQRTASGLWNSFWWNTPLYGTSANLSIVGSDRTSEHEAITREHLLALKPANAFETALLLSALMYLNTQADDVQILALQHQLLREQRSDGSWDSAPILRVVRRTCFDPWDSGDAGVLYADPNRLFTSATVLSALARTKVFTCNCPGSP